MKRIVAKLGGSSLADTNCMLQAVSRIRELRSPAVVVVSALGGITDTLLNAEAAALTGSAAAGEEAADGFRSQHSGIIESICSSHDRAALQAALEESCTGIKELTKSLSVLQERTERSRAQLLSRGERMAAKLLASALNREGLSVEVVDAAELVFVATRRGVTAPDQEKMARAAAKLIRPRLDQQQLVIVPGFLATDEDGFLTLLGRGGTDYSAALIASAIEADRLILFKEVDGFMTADPRYVKEARVIPRMHYREAGELAYYGAKILHPRTMIPVSQAGISLEIHNTFSGKGPGTIIDAEGLTREFPVKALTAIKHQTMITIEGRGMLGVPGIAGRTFAALAQQNVSVSVISQASSESSICFVVPQEESVLARRSLKSEFEWELEQKLIDDISAIDDLATVAVVGLGMSGYPGIAARVFSSLADVEINIVAIAQGSAEHNISLVIKQNSVPLALNALHDEFQLNKLRALASHGLGVTQVAVFGFGQIGRDLALQMANQRAYFRDHVGIDLVCIGLVDRSGMVMEPKGFGEEKLRALTALKKEEGQLCANPEDSIQALRQRLFTSPIGQGILVDTTAAETAPLLAEALEAGFNVVLANKKPLAVPQDEYDRLFQLAEARDLSLRFEATVGAGLPILDTLDKLDATGDTVRSIEGCLSGTLGFLFTLLADGKSYSEAVQEAYEKGYTEPDPRDDLDGMDVGRKALILARRLGYRLDIEDIDIEPLFPKELSDDDPKKFIANLKSIDAEWRQRCEAAAKARQTLRYVARISPEGVVVGVEEVAIDSPIGALRGTDNQVVITTRRYDANPLVVKGPGAGAGVTAQGVLNDIVTIALSHRKRLRRGRKA